MQSRADASEPARDGGPEQKSDAAAGDGDAGPNNTEDAGPAKPSSELVAAGCELYGVNAIDYINKLDWQLLLCGGGHSLKKLDLKTYALSELIDLPDGVQSATLAVTQDKLFVHDGKVLRSVDLSSADMAVTTLTADRLLFLSGDEQRVVVSDASDVKSISVKGGDVVSLCHNSSVSLSKSDGDRVFCVEDSRLKSVVISTGQKSDLAPVDRSRTVDRLESQWAWLDQATKTVRVVSSDATAMHAWSWGDRDITLLDSFTPNGQSLLVFGRDGWSVLSVVDGTWKPLAATPVASPERSNHVVSGALLLEDTFRGEERNTTRTVPLGALPLSGDPFVMLGTMPSRFWDDQHTWQDPFTLSGDGKTALFPTDAGWMLLDLATLTKQPLTSGDDQVFFDGTTGQFSLDDQLLLFVDCRAVHSVADRECATVVVDRQGKTVVRIAGLFEDSRWISPDSQHILVTHEDGRFVAATRSGEVRSGTFGGAPRGQAWVQGDTFLFNLSDGVHALSLAE